MKEIFEKTSWLEVVVEKLEESNALRESDRVVADRKRWAIIVIVDMMYISKIFLKKGGTSLDT